MLGHGAPYTGEQVTQRVTLLPLPAIGIGRSRTAPVARCRTGVALALSRSCLPPTLWRPQPGRRKSPRDHPRIRGEHGPGRRWCGGCRGPSPRARGAVLVDSDGAEAAGTIPACAGSRGTVGRRSSGWWDHPRVRGEQPAERVRGQGRLGPSPRARGADGRSQRTQLDTGTIPACAGSSQPRGGSRSGRRDHPRVRGEQSLGNLASGVAGGPSPRARGAVRDQRPAVHLVGTIPACAGSSRDLYRQLLTDRDHPRVRGEQG